MTALRDFVLGKEIILTARLIEYRDIAPEVRHFVFEVLGMERLEFEPGQFVSVTETVQGRAMTRAYSIASPPDGNRFDLCLNRVREGLVSPRLFDKRPGDQIEVAGPLGYFKLRDSGRDAVFVAVGTGIAPFRAMLHHPATFFGGRRITLLFGARHQSVLLYDHEWLRLEQFRKDFRYLPTLTRPAEGWQGRSGRVQLHLEEATRGWGDVDVYICGMREMVEETRRLLKEHGFGRERIITEKYD